jgi:hypothetical protein
MENESLLKPKFDPKRLMIFGAGDLITRLYIYMLGSEKQSSGATTKKQGVTNTWALPIERRCCTSTYSEHQNNPFESEQSKHFHQRKRVHLI